MQVEGTKITSREAHRQISDHFEDASYNLMIAAGDARDKLSRLAGGAVKAQDISSKHQGMFEELTSEYQRLQKFLITGIKTR